MNKFIITAIIAWLLPLMANAQSADQNYILTQTYTSASACIEKIQYYDGLGRPVETVEKGITPSGADLITYQEYDSCGRENKLWLPVNISGNSGKFATLSTIQSQAPGKYDGDAYPYSETKYEASPLNRITEQYGPGQSWRTNNRRVVTDYLTNSASGDLACKRYSLSSDNLYQNGPYDAGVLYVTKTTDENNNVSYEFKDKLGQVVLQRRMNGATCDTYFVYDDFGNLRYVLPPLAADATATTGTTYLPTTDAVANYAYIYRYDSRNRCTEKKLPGAEWIYMVYDKADRLRLTQDGVQRTNDEWTYYKYDALGRQIVMGILKKKTDLATMQTNVNNNTVLYETLDTNAAGKAGFRSYTNVSYPATAELVNMTEQLTNYYDNYQFSYGEWLDYFIQTPAGGVSDADWSSAKGLLTGSRSYTPAGEYIRRSWRYNAEGQVVQELSTNMLQYALDRTFYMYNYRGQPVKKQIHTAEYCNSPAKYMETYNYGYNKAELLVAKAYQMNSESPLSFSYTYDEFCRLKTKQLSGSETTAYLYNLRSWLKDVSGNKFSEKLYYDQPNTGGTARFNGDISEIQYKTTPNTVFDRYTFKYDGLNRMTDAIYSRSGSSADYSELLSYDKQGNISSMSRYGRYDNYSFSQIDIIGYNYTGNRVRRISDMKSNQNSSDLMEFKYNNTGSDQYSYDVNGRMTSDLNKKINKIEYNFLHLPRRIDQQDGNWIEYIYDATGVKQQVKTYLVGKATVTRDYRANKVYENNVLKMVLTEDGYVEPAGSSFNYYFYIKDHLGNNRVVADRVGTVVQATNYYPFGLSFAENPPRTDQDKQPYKFNGKELDRAFGLDTYDYGARMYNPAIGRFLTMDPLAEVNPNISPYVYALNNPIRNIDPDGRDVVVLNNPSGAYFAGAARGHMAILVGNDETGWTYISKGGRVDREKTLFNNTPIGGTSIVKNESFPTLEDFYNDKHLGQEYTQSVRFGTSTDQDKAAIEAAEKSARSRYHGIFSNCADAVSAGLKAAGLNPGYSYGFILSPIPNVRFGNIKKNNPTHIFIDLPEVIITGSKSKNSVQNSNKSFDERMQDMLWQSATPNSFWNTGRYNQPGRTTDQYYSDDFLKWYYDK